MGARIQVNHDKIKQVCLKHGIRRLSLFGSVLRDDFSPTSDIDVLVEFEPDVKVSLFKYMAISEELETIFGRKVDMVTLEGISPYLRDRIAKTSQVVYDGGAQ